MKIFITGGTGYLGNLLAHQLANAGHSIHALVRNKQKASLLEHKNIRVFLGDINDPGKIGEALCGCGQVYHVAGQVKPWMEDSSVFYRSNAEATSIICEQAIRAGVQKMVFTSTTGVVGPTKDAPLDESSSTPGNFFLDYDRSKKMAEDIVLAHVVKGLNAVIVSPAKVFGPGLASHSLAANTVIRSFLRKRFILIPSPGTYKLCFAYSKDVVNGHILAMEKGEAGQKYILGGYNTSYHDFFDRIRKLAGSKSRWIIPVSKPFVKLAGYLQEFNHKVTGAPVHFTPGSVDVAFRNYMFSSEKAIKQLGYTITPLETSLTETIKFLNNAL